ncbi:MAG: nucleotidyltransferase family protein [Pseudomonadota bacterium]
MTDVHNPQRPRPISGVRQTVRALVLAAGFGRRFGADKRQARLASGEPLLHAALRPYIEAQTPLTVVLRPEDTALASSLTAVAPRIAIAYAAAAAAGMGHSLAAGVEAVRSTVTDPSTVGLIVGLGDMPHVRAATVRALAHALAVGSAADIVQPYSPPAPAAPAADPAATDQARRGGNPIGFGSDWLAALETLRGDAGARELVAAAAREGRLTRLAVNDEGIYRDVDSPADLRPQR